MILRWPLYRWPHSLLDRVVRASRESPLHGLDTIEQARMTDGTVVVALMKPIASGGMESRVGTAIFFSKVWAKDFAHQWVRTRVGALDQLWLFRDAIRSTHGVTLSDAVIAFWPDDYVWPGMHPLMNVLKSCGVTDSEALVVSALTDWAEHANQDLDFHNEGAYLNDDDWIMAYLRFDPLHGFSTTVG